MPANVDAMVRAGVDAFKAGKKAEARTLLERAIELDGYNETAWLWLSAVVETPEEQQTCLENVLTINPNNERARQGLKSLGINPTIPSSPAASSAPAFAAGTFDLDEAEDIFATPASSPAPKAAAPAPKAPPKPAQDDLFADVDFSSDSSNFEFDDNLFGDDPYGSDDGSYDSYDAADDDLIDDSLFEDDGDDMYADRNTLDSFESEVDAVDYDDSLFDEDPLAPPPPPKAAPARASSPQPAPAMMSASVGRSILKQIPAEIEAGRMPGTNESIPSVHYMILGVLALVNLGALGFIALQFFG